MSDSDGIPETPSDQTLTRALRDAVDAIYKTGKHEDLTIKRVRTAAEKELDLPQGFFKDDRTWKGKSHDIILAAVGQCTKEPEPVKKTAPPKPKPEPKPVRKKAPVAAKSSRGVKRRVVAEEKPPKRRKTAISSSSEESEPADEPAGTDQTPSEEEVTDAQQKGLAEKSKRARKQKAQQTRIIEDESEDDAGVAAPAISEGAPDELNSSPQAKPSESKAHVDTSGDISESELSSLIDDDPPTKKRQKKAPTEKRGKEAKATASKIKTAKSKGTQDVGPDETEIKRLQGWLVKCGIRKIWAIELGKFDSSKAKINHLKTMLKDVGMGGRPSVEKAAAIKEQRELAAELEAIKEGEKSWGTKEDDDTGRPRRRLARRAQAPVPPPVAMDDEEDEEQSESDQESDDDSDADADDQDQVESSEDEEEVDDSD